MTRRRHWGAGIQIPAMSLDDQIREASEALTRRLREEFEAEFRRLAGELSTSVEREREAIAAETQRVVETEARRALETEVSQIRAETERTIAERLAAAQAEADRRVEAEAARVRAETEQAIADKLAASHTEADRSVEVEVARVRAEADQALERERAASRAEADGRVETEAARLRMEVGDALERELAATRSELEQRHQAELGKARAEADEAAATATAVTPSTTEDATSARREARQAASAERQRALQVMRRLNGSASLTDVLDALLDGAGSEAGRAVLLLVAEGRVRGWGATGFGADAASVRTLDFAVDQRGIVGQVVESGDVVTVSPAESDPDRDLIPGLARIQAGGSAVAVPVRVGGQIVAVLYADTGHEPARPEASTWHEAVELLALHAGRCAEAVTAARWSQLAMGTAGPVADTPAGGRSTADDEDGARRYARLVVSEIKLYHDAAVTTGREQRDLGVRLRAEIDQARSLYEEKIATDLLSRDQIFADELVRTLADGDASLLGE